jgi:hypothetical protein
MNNDSPVRVTFLLGAGASKDAGLPLAIDLFECIKASFRDSLSNAPDDASREQIRLESSLWDFIRSRMRAVDLPAFDADNFEAVVETLEALRRATSHPLAPFVRSWNAGLDDFAPPGKTFGTVHEDFWASLQRPFDRGARIFYGFGNSVLSESEVMDRLSFRIRSGIRRWVQRDFSDNDLDYLSALATEARGRQVFTLNYDVSLEAAAQRVAVPVSTGFVYARHPYPFPPHEIVTGKWVADSFQAVADDGLRLYKLHGSIDWFVERAREKGSELFSARQQDLTASQFQDLNGLDLVRTVTEDGPTPLLFAATGKLPSYEPFLTLYKSFIESLAITDVLVIIGCQWHTEPVISDTIGNAVGRRSVPMRLIEVTGGSSGETDSETRLLGGARDAILTGRLSAAIRDACESVRHMRKFYASVPR